MRVERTVVLIALGVVVPTCHAENLICDEVFAGAVALNDGGHHVLRHVLVVGEQLFGVLGEAVAAVTEGGVIIMCTDAWVEAYALDNGLGIESFDFGVGVEFVEVADAEGEVGVGEEFYGFCFLETHEENRDTLVLKLRVES